MFMLLLVALFGVLVIAVVLIFASLHTSAVSAEADRKEKFERVAQATMEHSLVHALAAGDVIIGAAPAQRALFYKMAEQQEVWIPYSALAGVELTPIWQVSEDNVGETRTKRGNQLVSAGIGAALAGPVGAVIGGLSAKTTTTSFSSTSRLLSSLELKLRIKDPRKPFLSLEITERNIAGTNVTSELRHAAESLAALIANNVEENEKPAQLVPATSDPTLFPESRDTARQPYQPQRGWWQRTFGG
ncbi:hypothetical protein M0208_10875 [Sphingomonas sp. SUN019]|uniref:hypothetical protein n=1 Tax=Sphingomonas sp. SUN019 TaxID=2937788 RepID=UPI002164CAD4|nr:hypothetical protein [Sphingomonas sp. SUN019]UVO50995.1 hypothetical protein M0208_10875 [Sphingomonas sp. SUN019]